MTDYKKERIVMVGGKLYHPLTSDVAQLAIRVTSARARLQAMVITLSIMATVGLLHTLFGLSWRTAWFSSLAAGLSALGYWSWRYRALRMELTQRERDYPADSV